MDEMEPVSRFPGMSMWLCSYDGAGGRWSIVLPAASSEQVLEDWCDTLPGLTVDGVLMAEGPAK